MNRVLVINDSKFERMILSDMLNQMGFNVMISDEYDAVKRVQSFIPDLIIVNYIMKETTGDELIALIKKKLPSVTCFLSSSNKLEKGIDCKNADFIIRTPIDISNLNEAIQRTKKMKQSDSIAKIEKENIKKKLEEWKKKTEEATVQNQFNAENNIDSKSESKDTQPKKENINYCHYCGSKMENNNISYVFCPYCGKKL